MMVPVLRTKSSRQESEKVLSECEVSSVKNVSCALSKKKSCAMCAKSFWREMMT